MKRLLNSPTIATWFAFLSKSVGLIVLFPLLLTTFSKEIISVFFLFEIFIGLQMLANVGFHSTLVRAVAYAAGGSKEITIHFSSPPTIEKDIINWDLIERIYSTIHYLLSGIAILFFLFLSTLGSLSVNNSIQLTSQQDLLWASWVCIIVATVINQWGQKYVIYLKGLNKVALVMKWQGVFNFFTILSSSIILILTKDIFFVILVLQLGVILNVIRNRWLCKRVFNNKFTKFKKRGFDKKIFQGIFPSSWRMWVAQLTSYGTIQASGIIYAQVGNVDSVSSYLIALRTINYIKQFSNAPFYSKIPLYSRLFIKNNISELIKVVKRGMFLSFSTFTVLIICVGLCGDRILSIIHSNANFVDLKLWTILSIAIWFERYGAMHIQLYSITNHIIAHVANGVSSIIYLVITFLLLPFYGILSFPIALLIGNLGFYSWYAAIFSNKIIKINRLQFELESSIIPFGVILLYTIIVLII